MGFMSLRCCPREVWLKSVSSEPADAGRERRATTTWPVAGSSTNGDGARKAPDTAAVMDWFCSAPRPSDCSGVVGRMSCR